MVMPVADAAVADAAVADAAVADAASVGSDAGSIRHAGAHMPLAQAVDGIQAAVGTTPGKPLE